jgi:hypothetical protein
VKASKHLASLLAIDWQCERQALDYLDSGLVCTMTFAFMRCDSLRTLKHSVGRFVLSEIPQYLILFSSTVFSNTLKIECITNALNTGSLANDVTSGSWQRFIKQGNQTLLS